MTYYVRISGDDDRMVERDILDLIRSHYAVDVRLEAPFTARSLETSRRLVTAYQEQVDALCEVIKAQDAQLAEIRESSHRVDGALPRSWAEDVEELDHLRFFVNDAYTVVIDIPGKGEGTGTFHLRPGGQHRIDRSHSGFDAIVTALEPHETGDR